METFREALRAELDAAGLSQPKAAELIGIPQAVVSQYLSGRRFPNLETLAKLIRVFPRLIRWVIMYLFDVDGK